MNAGGALATVYRSESALNDHRQLRALRSRLEQLRYAREASRDAETALKLDGDIREGLFALRASLAAGIWTSVESSGEELRTTVLKREYAYAGTDDLDVRIDALNAEISTLSGRLEGGTHDPRAVCRHLQRRRRRLRGRSHPRGAGEYDRRAVRRHRPGGGKARP